MSKLLNETFQKHLGLFLNKFYKDNPTKKLSFLNESDEDVTQLAPADMKAISIKLKNLYDSPLPDFVGGLKSIISDPKVQIFLKSAKHDGNLTDDNISISADAKGVKVNTLKPTQNEVFLDKSIEYPMKKDPDQIRNFILAGKQEGMPAIVTSGGYVIDGHHRWSQVFCWNKDAFIPTYNITFNANEPDIPTDLLKKTFLGIAAIDGVINLSDKGGELNLFNIQEDALGNWLTGRFTTYPGAWAIFCENEVMAKIKPKEAQQIQFLNINKFREGDSLSYLNKVVVPYLYSNIETLRNNGKGIYSRKIMPQTGGDIAKFATDLKAGNINFDINVDEPNDQQSTPLPSQPSVQSEKMINETFQRHLTLLHKKLKLNENTDINQVASTLQFKPVTKQKLVYKYVENGKPGSMSPMTYTKSTVQQPVVTTTTDGKETQNTAEVGDVIMSGATGENYVVKAAKLPKLYTGNVGSDIYPEQSPRQVALYNGEPVTFKAPWGEDMIIKPGDYLVKDPANTGYYRIAKVEFEKTYNKL
jgi:hypothetical protein